MEYLKSVIYIVSYKRVFSKYLNYDMEEIEIDTFDLESYLSNEVEKIIKGILKASLKNPKASFFMLQHVKNSKKAREKRIKEEQLGNHIPPFLIASITDKCNLHCKGCYARANHSCIDYCGKDDIQGLMTSGKWNDIFKQSSDLGIEFIILVGGEPFVRKDVLKVAGDHKDILFPIFTNGTMIDKSYLDLLDSNRNLMPVLSIEGNRNTTDLRRGQGVFDKLQNTMNNLNTLGILFGASVTVTKQNMNEVLSDEFIENLKGSGAKAVIYVEYVPMDEKTKEIALDDVDRDRMMSRLDEIRKKEYDDMIFIAFPGDEDTSNGCLAAGRGFFHINAHGGAEPCPFSPYSDMDIIKSSLKEALQSPLFKKLQQSGNLSEKHIGGCVLFEQKDKVQKLLYEEEII